MAQTKEITFHRRAAMALDAFPRAARTKVRAAVRRIQDPASGALICTKVAKLPTDEPLYIMRASPDIRVIFRKMGDAIDVLDVVRRDTLDTFAKEPRAAARPPEPKGNGASRVRGSASHRRS
jgi:hypothetical protein